MKHYQTRIIGNSGNFERISRQKIEVYTDHKNLSYKNFNIKGEANIVADALSRLEMDSKNIPKTVEEQAKAYRTEKFLQKIFHKIIN